MPQRPNRDAAPRWGDYRDNNRRRPDIQRIHHNIGRRWPPEKLRDRYARGQSQTITGIAHRPNNLDTLPDIGGGNCGSVGRDRLHALLKAPGETLVPPDRRHSATVERELQPRRDIWAIPRAPPEGVNSTRPPPRLVGLGNTRLRKRSQKRTTHQIRIPKLHTIHMPTDHTEVRET